MYESNKILPLEWKNVSLVLHVCDNIGRAARREEGRGGAGRGRGSVGFENNQVC